MSGKTKKNKQDFRAPEIRPIVPSDITGYVKLQSLIFWNSRSNPMAEEYFRWKLYRNHLDTVKGAVAIDKDKLVGIYATIPLKLSLNTAIYTCYEVVASSVHPDYRGKYIFHKLFYKTREIFLGLSNNVLLFGFPNEKAAKIGQRSLTYKRISYIREYVKILDFRALIDKRRNSIFLRGFLCLFNPVINRVLNFAKDSHKINSYYQVETKPISELPSDYDSFWEEAKNKYKIFVVRNRSYLQWRFFNEPYFQNQVFEVRIKEKLVGYFVLKFEGRSVRIVDFFCIRNEKIIEKTFYAILRLIKKRKGYKIIFRVKDDYIEELLAKEKFYVEDASAFVIGDICNSRSGLENKFSCPQDWYITGNSFDLG